MKSTQCDKCQKMIGAEDTMPVYDIMCKVIENEYCPYVEGEYLLSRTTPGGMCAASFSAIWPFANAMRHSEHTSFEDAKGEVTVACPDGWVQFRLSRLRSKNATL